MTAVPRARKVGRRLGSLPPDCSNADVGVSFVATADTDQQRNETYSEEEMVARREAGSEDREQPRSKAVCIEIFIGRYADVVRRRIG